MLGRRDGVRVSALDDRMAPVRRLFAGVSIRGGRPVVARRLVRRGPARRMRH
ncbi:hypothetical protein [Micromonospora sp. NPDC023737]|uniref:hypothetical protein n=1 Tax=unclassified Micromonospora TaxID=2617518 RepID=UPI0033D5D851